MTRKALVILIALLGACTAGPDPIESYRGSSFTLNARFADPSAPEFSWLVVNVDVISSDRLEQQPEVKHVSLESAAVPPLVGGSARIEISASGAIPQDVLGVDVGEVRFFRVTAGEALATAPNGGPFFGLWTLPGYDLVYAQVSTTFSPYGPTGPTIEFPKGYSWLRRTCGATPGLIEMAVASPEGTVDFHYAGPWSNWPQENWSIDEEEQALVESCGAAVPAVDLGSRVTFDRAQELVWSADGASIFYLAPADPQDRTQSVSLRHLRLTDAATDEVVVIPFGQGLQGDSTGQLYVGNASNLLRVDLASGSPAALVVIPAPAYMPSPHYALLSPNGHWLEYQLAGGDQRVWDLQSGTDAFAVDGWFAGWSPDSSLGYWSATGFNLLSLATPSEAKTYAVPTDAHPISWNTDGPAFPHVPFDWSMQKDPSGLIEGCSSCFGLSLQDPDTGAERPVLDASAGMIDIVSTPPVLGFMLVWARTCLGLYNTVCSYSLMRVDLTNGTARTVAVSASELPVAVSPDYQSVAIAATNGIYVKSLAP